VSWREKKRACWSFSSCSTFGCFSSSSSSSTSSYFSSSSLSCSFVSFLSYLIVGTYNSSIFTCIISTIFLSLRF
jgi:hypothetical protein